MTTETAETVVITLTRDEFDFVLMRVGMVAGMASRLGHSESRTFYDFLKLDRKRIEVERAQDKAWRN